MKLKNAKFQNFMKIIFYVPYPEANTSLSVYPSQPTKGTIVLILQIPRAKNNSKNNKNFI